MWVGLLFSIMSVSALLQHRDTELFTQYSIEDQGALENYRTMTIHCLIAGDYQQPSRYTIETLTLHFGVDQQTNSDTNINNWLLIGVIIRIALRMGLHRDPSHWLRIRPLEAEFRRRIWITLYHMDYFTSTQVGLPRIIKDSQCDARPPANLLYHDLNFEDRVPPPERPLTEETSFSSIIQRHIIIKVAAEIYDVTETASPSPTTIDMLAAKLEKAITTIPEQSRYRPLEESIADSPAVILRRILMDILIQKAIYLLHRRSLMKGFSEKETAKSSTLCIDAALAILDHQRRLNEESQSGGIMFGIRWKVSSWLSHEFLQATMMLCLVLNRFHEASTGTADTKSLPKRDKIITALTNATNLWNSQANMSPIAQKAEAAIMRVLKHHFEQSNQPFSSDPNNQQFSNQLPAPVAPSFFAEFDDEQNMVLDHSFSMIDADMAAYSSLWNDFNNEPIGDSGPGMY